MSVGAKQRRAVALVRAGASYTAAGEKVGLSRSAVSGACGRAGLKTGRGWPRHDIDWAKEFKRADRFGESTSQIATRLGVGRMTVWRHRRDLRYLSAQGV